MLAELQLIEVPISSIALSSCFAIIPYFKLRALTFVEYLLALTAVEHYSKPNAAIPATASAAVAPAAPAKAS